VPPRSVANQVDEEEALASAVGRMITVTPEREEQMEAALWDLALGHAVLLPYGAKPPQGVTIETITVLDENGEPGHIRIYLRPPDTAMLKLLIEQNVGRPGSRYAREREQTILVQHAVPGWDEEEEMMKAVAFSHPTADTVDFSEVSPWPKR